jgi:hypothetical protein
MKTYYGERVVIDDAGRGFCSVDVGNSVVRRPLKSTFVNVELQSKSKRRGKLEEAYMSTDPIPWDWGYRGIYPYGLAKSILDDLFSANEITPDPDTVSSFHLDIIAKLPYENWELTETQIYDFLVTILG